MNFVIGCIGQKISQQSANFYYSKGYNDCGISTNTKKADGQNRRPREGKYSGDQSSSGSGASPSGGRRGISSPSAPGRGRSRRISRSRLAKRLRISRNFATCSGVSIFRRFSSLIVFKRERA